MGQSDLFAKATFAKETERITCGAATWQDPPEIRLEKVQGDGLLLVREPRLLGRLATPWPAAETHEEILVELKLAGDHVDRKAVERALLRRQARQVQRVEAPDTSWLGHQPLWVVAPHVPEWLGQAYSPMHFAPGCYRVEPLGRWFLWVAANELPLRDELVPFLVARSGQALDEFARWVADRRPLDWVLGMLRYLAMSTSVREELMWRFGEPESPEIEERERQMAEIFLEARPRLKERLVEEGRLAGERAALRRVLAAR